MLRFIPLPPGLPEFLLLCLIVACMVFVMRRIGRRRAFARADADIPLPSLTTDVRVRGVVRRVYRDPEQGVWLMELSIAKRRFALALTDYAARPEQYTGLVGKEADIALYAMATLAPGGAEAMRDQIRDISTVDLSTDPVRLLPGGQMANDHVVIGKALSHRDEEMDGIALTIYRTQVVRAEDLTLVMELAVDAATTPLFEDGAMVHGSARLYGTLAIDPS